DGGRGGGVDAGDGRAIGGGGFQRQQILSAAAGCRERQASRPRSRHREGGHCRADAVVRRGPRQLAVLQGQRPLADSRCRAVLPADKGEAGQVSTARRIRWGRHSCLPWLRGQPGMSAPPTRGLVSCSGKAIAEEPPMFTRSLALLFVLLTLGLCAAEEKKDTADPKQIARQIEELGDRRHAKREAAERALRQIGVPALDALREAARSKDAEVRRRATRLLRQIENLAEAARLLASPRLRLVYKDTPLADAVADIEKKTGIAIKLEGDT